MENNVNFDSINDSVELYNKIKDDLAKYTALGESQDMAIRVDDEKIIKIWRQNIKPYSDMMSPIIDELIAHEEKLKEIKASYDEAVDKYQKTQQHLQGIQIKRNKFINRISPLIIKAVEGKLGFFQEVGSIDEKDGVVYVKIQDHLAAAISTKKKVIEKHHEEITNKIQQKDTKVFGAPEDDLD